MSKVQKEKITAIEQLNKGDVILCIWRRGLERNRQSSNPIPVSNYRHVMVVTDVRKLDNGKVVFDHSRPENLSSTNGDHKIVEKAIFSNFSTNPKIACTTSSFGGNHGIKGYEIWRLTEVKSRPNTFRDMPVLKGNPAYDLMM